MLFTAKFTARFCNPSALWLEGTLYYLHGMLSSEFYVLRLDRHNSITQSPVTESVENSGIHQRKKEYSTSMAVFKAFLFEE